MHSLVSSTDEILETMNYYPFGSEMMMETPSCDDFSDCNTINHDLSRFTGKELDRRNGLNWYDFGARIFDVAGIPAWTRMDPLAEDNPQNTPYSYCNGDPVNRIDPDGMFSIFINGMNWDLSGGKSRYWRGLDHNIKYLSMVTFSR